MSNAARFRQLYADLSCKLIGQPKHRYSSVSDVPAMPCEPGPFIRKFRDKFAKQLRELCGADGEGLVKLGEVLFFVRGFNLGFVVNFFSTDGSFVVELLLLQNVCTFRYFHKYPKFSGKWSRRSANCYSAGNKKGFCL